MIDAFSRNSAGLESKVPKIPGLNPFRDLCESLNSDHSVGMIESSPVIYCRVLSPQGGASHRDA